MCIKLKHSYTILIVLLITAFQHFNAEAQQHRMADLESEILRILDDHNIPGASVALVTKDSIIWSASLGLADIENNIPVTEQTLFSIGSISKTFLSATAMIAEEQELLNINDPINKLVPSLRFSNQWEKLSPVRLIHLLEHTSGFDEAHFNLFPVANSSTPFEEVMKISEQSLETRWKPGKYFEYNTLGYIVAAYILEENIGESFSSFASKQILLPLGMDNATYHPNDSTTPHFSKGYAGDANIEVPFPDIPQWPAGTLTTKVDGMANFIRMLLNNGQFEGKQILTESSVKRMETPESSIRAGAGIPYGYGKGIQGTFEKGNLFYGHSGRAGGFLSEFGYSRNLNLGYIILINNVDGGKAIKAIKSVLLSSIYRPEIEPEKEISEIDITLQNEILGFYQPITSVPQLGEIAYFIYRLIDMPIIEEKDGRLYQSSILGDKLELLQAGNLLFRNAGEPMASSAFAQDVEGNWLWLTNDASYKQISTWFGYTQFYMALICILIIAMGFISLIVWIPLRWLRRKRENIQLQLFPLLSISSLVGMIASILLFYNPEKMYSLGAVLFLIFGWLFFILSFLGLVKLLVNVSKNIKVNTWLKYHALIITIACCISSLYLLYWDIIGLMLWDY